MKTKKLASVPTIKRLPLYLQIVENAHKDGKEFISGTIIADELELEPIQVRKDLAITGIVGRPRIGFPVGQLIRCIHEFLLWDQEHSAIVVGAGSLGAALMGYDELKKRGMRIQAAFDNDPAKTGQSINGVPVYPMSDIAKEVKRLGSELAILTVPPEVAQTVAEQLASAGIHAIWNFTNTKLKLNENIVVQREDLSSGYAMLSVRMKLGRS
jgi:redox-sensing transcriptional repressor